MLSPALAGLGAAMLATADGDGMGDAAGLADADGTATTAGLAEADGTADAAGGLVAGGTGVLPGAAVAPGGGVHALAIPAISTNPSGRNLVRRRGRITEELQSFSQHDTQLSGRNPDGTGVQPDATRTGLLKKLNRGRRDLRRPLSK